jgi:hypothetical protein
MTIYSAASSLSVPAAEQSRCSVWRRCFEAVMGGRQRKADAELVNFLRNHRYSLSNELIAELERRRMTNGRQA